MKNKKGQLNALGGIIVGFIAVIVGLALINGGIYQNIGTATLTNTIVNQSITFPAAGANVTLTGQAVEITRITNASNALVPATNYTVTNYVLSNGQLTSVLQARAGWYNGNLTNVTYISEPFGYERSSAGRAVINLIAIFAALAVAVLALTPSFRDYMKDLGGF